MTAFEIVIKIISCITPFALLIMGWIYTSAIRKRDKREDANKKLEEEKKAAEKKEQEEKEEKHEQLIKDQNDKIDALAQDIASMKVMIEEAHKADLQTDKKINRLAISGDMTSTKVSELATVVMILAEGLRDQHLDGNITRAVEKYRKYESDTLNKVVHDAYTDTKNNMSV